MSATKDTGTSGEPSKTLNIRKNQVIKQTIHQLYSDREETGDVTFIVESQCIRAHRCILAAMSAKYKAQFYGLNPDMGDINVSNKSAASFNEFLQFFYLEEIVLTVENIEDVLNLAKESLVDGISNECVSFLTEIVTELNLCWTYRLAILHDIKQLKDVCEPRITENITKIFRSDDFINCDHKLLMHILKLESLNCKETTVFDACISWAKNACEQKNVDCEKVENLRVELADAVGQIRFASLSIDEFAALHKSYEGFFSPDECAEIFFIIGKLKDFKSERFNQIPRNPCDGALANQCDQAFQLLFF